MLNRDQQQKVEEGSTAIQAGGNVAITVTGLTYAEVREVALDVFQANFYELAGAAKATADARAEEITEAILTKLQREYPEGFAKASDPDFQYALFTVQKEYARSGDKELGDLLVDLLVERSKQPHRNLIQLVLNESLNTAPKLTEGQLAVLAVMFIFLYTDNHAIGNHQIFGEYLDKCVKPFVPALVKNMASYQHLQYSGCGANRIGLRPLEEILGSSYQGLFQKGFEPEQIANRHISIGTDTRFFIPCLNDPEKIQVNALNAKLLDIAMEENTINDSDRDHISKLFFYGKMSEPEIKQKSIEIRPYMSDLFDVWSESAMKSFQLTSVGIAIGHANVKRLAGEFADLSIWIN